ncbi:hypothetical protein JR311_19930 (plasmid) [Bacillus velezensis]|uniref:hypothetical protein n=1 Tax=Bacillus velezensis TaxID=492670 RepID=UPI00195B8F17|nr:hypothetical protein [Bacillus velezensis]QRV11475.1 hypothetical protein JR311_19930 [Bacillus velezensis]
MSYDSIFQKRMTAKGLSKYDRAMHRKSRSFNAWFQNALSREPVLIDGVSQYAVFQDQNQNNNKDLSDDKYVVVENQSNLKVGSLIDWREKKWMVFTEENKTIPTHKQAKIKQSNGYIKWMIGDKVSGNGDGHPAFIQNQTLYTLGVSTSGNHSWIVNAKMMMYMQDNDETRNLKINQRIFIGGAVYQVMFKDYVSRRGLINYLLEQDFINSSRDNIELGVADYFTNEEDDDGIQNDTTEVKEVVISGPDKAKIGSVVELNIDDTNYEVSEWTVADTESSVSIVEQDVKHIKVRVENNFKKVGSIITIIAKTKDGVIGTKTVKITSPY